MDFQTAEIEIGNPLGDELPLSDELCGPVSQGADRAFSVSLDELPEEGGIDPTVGTVTWRTLISADRTPSCDLTMGIADFPPHGTLNAHRHLPPEFYLGLSGTGVVTIDGVPHTISQGVAVYIPANAEHDVLAGSKGLTFAYGFAKSAFSDIEYVFSDRNPL